MTRTTKIVGGVVGGLVVLGVGAYLWITKSASATPGSSTYASTTATDTPHAMSPATYAANPGSLDLPVGTNGAAAGPSARGITVL